MTTIRNAINLATRLHDGVYRKNAPYPNAQLPYIVHPARVAANLSMLYPIDYVKKDAEGECGWTFSDIVVAGWCHDLLEDTDITEDDLYREIGAGAFFLVKGMTNVKRHVKNRFEQKFLDRQRLRQGPKDVCVIKLIDRLDNVRELSDMEAGFQRLYAIESLSLVDALLFGLSFTDWRDKAIRSLGAEIGEVVEKYLPKGEYKNATGSRPEKNPPE